MVGFEGATSLAFLRHETPSRAVFSPDGRRFLVAAGSRLLMFSRDGELLVEAEMPQRKLLKPFAHGMAWAIDDVHVAVAENPTLRLRRVADLSVVAEDEHVLGRVAFCEGGRSLARARRDLRGRWRSGWPTAPRPPG